MNTVLILLLGAAVVAVGSAANIQQYPFAVALLASKTGVAHSQACGGTIISKQSVLTAAHCFRELPSTFQWRSRVGSSLSYTGGTVFNTNQIIQHPSYSPYTDYMDIAVIRIAGSFSFNDNVQAGFIAGPHYEIADNVPVGTIGWTLTNLACKECQKSDQLDDIEVYTVNQDTCNQLYSGIREYGIEESMVCAGVPDERRDVCLGDDGGPLLENNVVVGVRAWRDGCAQGGYPGVYTRVSAASDWITSNA